MTVRLVLLSDTHGVHQYIRVPDGDILIHAGDLTMHGRLDEVDAFNAHLQWLPHPHKLVIAGNHDFCFERQPEASVARLTNATYLLDQAVTLCGLKFYGSPWQPEFCHMAFNLPRGAALEEKWALIPSDTDVLITHTPPLGIGDETSRGERTGCLALRAAVERIRPQLHVFGHIHEAYGSETSHGMQFVNACTCDPDYLPMNAPVVVDWPA